MAELCYSPAWTVTNLTGAGEPSSAGPISFEGGRLQQAHDYLIDKLLPKQEIHLVAGPTGAGKTRWLFQTILDWSSGKPIFGCASYPVPWAYCSSDRTALSAKRTLDSMDIPSNLFPFIDAWDRRLTLNQILDEAAHLGAELLIIESFGSFVDHPATSTNVKRFMQACSAAIRKDGITVIGVMEQPKMKPKERYGNPRQRISGVASWGHFAETVIIIEPPPTKESTPEREIHICPRNGAELTLAAEFRSDGRLHYVAT